MADIVVKTNQKIRKVIAFKNKVENILYLRTDENKCVAYYPQYPVARFINQDFDGMIATLGGKDSIKIYEGDSVTIYF